MEFDLERYTPLPVRYELRYVMLRKLQEGEGGDKEGRRQGRPEQRPPLPGLEGGDWED